jgi:hypothetical protein
MEQKAYLYKKRAYLYKNKTKKAITDDHRPKSKKKNGLKALCKI